MKRLVEPRFVNAEARVCQQAVAIEPLDVVSLERAAIAPDVDVVFLHRDDEHRAGDRSADRRGVEVGNARGRDVERPCLQRGNPFVHQLAAAIDEPRVFGAVLQRTARDLVVILLVGLAEVGGVCVGNRALAAHPVECCARVEAAGKCDADLFAGRNSLKDRRHVVEDYKESGKESGK